MRQIACTDFNQPQINLRTRIPELGWRACQAVDPGVAAPAFALWVSAGECGLPSECVGRVHIVVWWLSSDRRTVFWVGSLRDTSLDSLSPLLEDSTFGHLVPIAYPLTPTAAQKHLLRV